jgi:hypothetical protein
VIYVPDAEIIHFLEREKKSVLHSRIGVHMKSILRYLIKDYSDLAFRKLTGQWN